MESNQNGPRLLGGILILASLLMLKMSFSDVPSGVLVFTVASFVLLLVVGLVLIASLKRKRLDDKGAFVIEEKRWFWLSGWKQISKIPINQFACVEILPTMIHAQTGPDGINGIAVRVRHKSDHPDIYPGMLSWIIENFTAKEKAKAEKLGMEASRKTGLELVDRM